MVILLVFIYQVMLANPNWKNIFLSALPTPELVAQHPVVNWIITFNRKFGNNWGYCDSHNFYLHSSICQTRKINHDDLTDVQNAVRFTTWDLNIQLIIAFFVNVLLLIMGAAVFKSGAVKDSSFFGLYDALSNTAMLSNPIFISVAKTGILSALFAVALLASGQNSTITGALTGQVVMEGFIHLKMPLWARRLFTRLLSVIPVIMCVLMTAKDSISQQHFALNMLLENSQVFLAFAVPFSIVPLLIMTDDRRMMGQFKNRKIWSILGWASSIILIFLNLCNLPATFVSFNMMPKRDAVVFAYAIIMLIILLMGWTCWDMRKKK